jgi:hypothetical protein
MMAEINLTQQEAEALIALEKNRVDDSHWDYPGLGGAIRIPLVSSDKKENFFLDVTRGRIDLSKGTYQNRSRQTVVLLRLDFGGQPHRNPDGEDVPSPHLHVYRESFGDKWAMPVPMEKFPNPTDLWQLFEDFMRFCNITNPPFIHRGLFS